MLRLHWLVSRLQSVGVLYPRAGAGEWFAGNLAETWKHVGGEDPRDSILRRYVVKIRGFQVEAV